MNYEGRIITCGTCGSDSIEMCSSIDHFQWYNEATGMMQYELKENGDVSVKCNNCGRSVAAVYSNNPSKIFPKMNGACNRMLTAFEGRSRRSRWAKCITAYHIPPRVWR